MNQFEANIRDLVVETIKEFENTPYVHVGISNRHVHLSEEDLWALFGKGYELTLMKELLQPGQFACKETVTIRGPKDCMEGVRILGPVRKKTQVEISLTDGFRLGVKAPVKESGDLIGAGLISIINPITGVCIERRCAIAALRHVHLSEVYAEKFGFKDKQTVSVEFGTERGLVFNNVLLRVSPDYLPEIHLDTDEANGGAIKNGDLGRIIP